MLNSSVKTESGTEEITAYTVDEVSEYLPKLKFLTKRRNKKSYLYATDYMTLDTETSHAGEDRGWIYQWAIKLADIYVYGRKPSELVQFFGLVRRHYLLDSMRLIIVYIHNSSYDIQYLKHYLKEYDPQLEIMATDAHSILICDILGFRILCSYRLSGLSLDLFSKTYAAKYRKAVGEIDYTVIRYQDTELREIDWYYMFSDVASQYDAIHGYITSRGYKYAFQAPYTSTGFVRSDCRKASEKAINWHTKFQAQALTLEQYNLCRQAFMGGLTIASWKYSGETVRSERLKHLDFTSSYPARIMMDYFPKGKPFNHGTITDMETLRSALDTYCCVFVAIFYGLRIKPGITAPYIPSSKAIYKENILKLNGKVVSADLFAMALTEIDFELIERQYTYEELSINDMVCFNRGPAPDFLKRQIMKYYDGKCKLKKSDPRLYMAAKANLNSIYGMTATALTRPSYKLDPDMIIEEVEENPAKQLKKYYDSYNSFLPYQYCLYVTAHSRKALIDMIECCGYDHFLYCDTDSVFYLETDENRQRLEEMNRKTKERAIAAGAYIDDNILGYATAEAPLRAFRALHAKCYAAEEQDKNGEYKLSVTIAGIPKKSTKWIDGKPVTMTNAEELESIDNLTDGFIFRHCGGTRIVYNEDVPRIENIDGHETELASSAVILNIEKEISDTMWTFGKDYEILETNISTKIE